MLVAQDGEGLVFAREERVASLTPAYPERWRVVLADGTVAYRPGPPGPGPWQPLGESLVLPQLLRATAEGWEDPAGFAFPPAPLKPVPLETVEDAIWALEDNFWHTDEGLVPCELPLKEALQLHPYLRQLQPGRFFNPRRLERIRLQGSKAVLSFGGERQQVVDRRWHSDLCETLGLTSLSRLEPFRPGLFRQFLREFPFELARARGEVLKAHFREADELMANLAWQARHYCGLGLNMGYGSDHGDFNYFPLGPALQRTGFMRTFRINGPLFRRFEQMLGRMVGKDRLFTFAELGFADKGEGLRRIGKRRPEVILLAEKGGVGDFCRGLAEQHDLSLFISGGVPRLVAVEFFVRALRQVYAGPVRVVALVDWDPGGHLVVTTLRLHLKRYGVKTPEEPLFLLRPELFTAEELELFPMTLTANTATEATVIGNWVERTGGIGGEARGITCNCLHPLERVVPALEQWLD